MAQQTMVLVGTRKGLWTARSQDGGSWTVTGPDEAMSDVHAVAFDKREGSPRLYLASRSWHWGPQVLRSDDLGASWQRFPDGGVAFPADTGASLEAVWSLAPSPCDPGVVWAGTQPSALFRSTDHGESFSLVRPLWDHPHREQWGAGFGGQAIHTLLPHPTDPRQLTVAMSTGGVYRTYDGGESWAPANRGIRAEFFPGDVQYPEFGQCVHKVARDPVDPDLLFAQNHGGVYRSRDGGDAWEAVADGLPADFGFPVVTHPRRSGTVYLFPLVGADGRWPPQGRARAFRSRDAGESWQELGAGLPDGFWSAVMRDAMCVDDADPAGVYFGSRDGTVFASRDEGETWEVVAEHLPDVLCVRAATV